MRLNMDLACRAWLRMAVIVALGLIVGILLQSYWTWLGTK